MEVERRLSTAEKVSYGTGSMRSAVWRWYRRNPVSRVCLPAWALLSLASVAASQVPNLAEHTQVEWLGGTYSLQSWNGSCPPDQALLRGLTGAPFCALKNELRAVRPTPSTSVASVTRILPRGHPRRWGGLDLLVGRTFTQRKSMFIPGLIYTRTFRWEGPDRVLAVDYVIEGETGTDRYEIDPATGFLHGYVMLEDGSISTPPRILAGVSTRRVIRVVNDNVFETLVQQERLGRWTTVLMGRDIFETNQAIQMQREQRDAFWNGAF